MAACMDGAPAPSASTKGNVASSPVGGRHRDAVPTASQKIVHYALCIAVVSYQLSVVAENRKPKTIVHYALCIVHWLMLAQHHVDDGVDIGNVDLAVASDISYVH